MLLDTALLGTTLGLLPPGGILEGIFDATTLGCSLSSIALGTELGFTDVR